MEIKMFMLICWGLFSTLMFLHTTAKREYFIPEMNLTWEEARNHCQVCFKDLVTLTPENTQNISQRLKSDHWIGLRKNFSPKTNSTDNTTDYASTNFTWSSISNFMDNSTSNFTSSPILNWTRWANGDPLAFQNWYPGWPVFKSYIPKRDCCSCSCTCPQKPTTTMSSFTRYTQFTATQSTQNVTNSSTSGNTTDIPDLTDLTDFTDITDITAQTDFTSVMDSNTDNMPTSRPHTNSTTTPFTTAAPYMTTTELPIEATCSRSSMPTPDVPETDDNYIEDSCVAMLSFGPWVEKSCLEVLPFICYEDQFYSQVNVTNLTSNSVTVTWEATGDGISRYRVEMKQNNSLIQEHSLDNMTCCSIWVSDLLAGTLSEVQVIPVKCERNLNPGKAEFYTTPNKVRNPKYTEVTEKSVFLSWDRPDGGFGFYTVRFENQEKQAYKEEIKVVDLIPGHNYTFTITTQVNGSSMLSEESSITVFTKPDKVSNLSTSGNTAMVLTWDKPTGEVKDYVVYTMYSGETIYNVTTATTFEVTGLPPATKITFSVTARNQNNTAGQTETTSTFTRPGPVGNLTLTTTSDRLNASWTFPKNEYIFFTVELGLDGMIVDTAANVTSCLYEFKNLRTAANYTVYVTAVIGRIKGDPVMGSKFTLPLKPKGAEAKAINSTSINFKWTPPDNAADSTMYSVCVSSRFWNEMQNTTVIGTNYEFHHLKSGSSYTFQVRTVADGLESEPVSVITSTNEDKREVILSLLCSSATSLYCDSDSARGLVFQAWKAHFEKSFGTHVYWDLQNYTAPKDTT